MPRSHELHQLAATIPSPFAYARIPLGQPEKLRPKVQEQLRELLYTFHGLRKNATNYLAELGLTPSEISVITAMSLEMVQHYTDDINNKRIAKLIAERVTGGDYFAK